MMQLLKITVLGIALSFPLISISAESEWAPDTNMYFHGSTSVRGNGYACTELSPSVSWDKIGLQFDPSDSLRMNVVDVDEGHYNWVYSQPTAVNWSWFNPLSWYGYYTTPGSEPIIVFHLNRTDIAKLVSVEFFATPQVVSDLLKHTTLENRQKIARMLPGDFDYFNELRELLKAASAKEAVDQTEG